MAFAQGAGGAEFIEDVIGGHAGSFRAQTPPRKPGRCRNAAALLPRPATLLA